MLRASILFFIICMASFAALLLGVDTLGGIPFERIRLLMFAVLLLSIATFLASLRDMRRRLLKS